MSQYHIYGIGNALVDIEYEIDDQKLQALGIDKGVMTLIEKPRMVELLDMLSDHTENRACGGSAANTMTAAQLLGARTFYSCKVANDMDGDFFYQELIKSGIATNLTADNRAPGETGKCIAKITPDAERTMCTYLGITSDYSKHEVDEAALANSEYLYIEGYLVASPPSRQAAMHAKALAEQHGVKTSITLSDSNMVSYFKDGLIEMIGDGVDLLFCNEQEALLFCGTQDLNEAKAQLKRYAKMFSITLGEKGALIYDGQQETHVPGQKIKVVDTLGAGDTFAGGFLYAITQGFSPIEATEIANHAASQVVAKLGPRLSMHEAKYILKQRLLMV